MLDQQSGSRSGGQWPETLQVLSKCLRTLAIFFAWDYLRNFHLPIAVYVFVLLVGSAFFFLLVQRPWRGQKPIRWIRIGKYSLLYVLNLVFWHVGLKCYGPLRTILAADYGDTILGPLLRKGKAQRSSKLPGAVLVLVSYLLLLWSYDPQANPGDNSVGGADVQRSNDFFGISDRIVGGVAILVAVVLNVIRRKYSKGLSLQLGSSKRLFSLSVVMGAAFLSPFATFSYFTAEPFGFSFLGFLFSMCGIILFFVIVEYYVANGRKGDRSGTAGRRTKLELMASLAISFALEWWYGSSGSTFALSAVNVIFFSLMLLGIQLRFTGGKNGLGSSNSDMLPLYGSIAQRGDTMAIGRWVYNFLKTTLKEVLKNADSRNIFLFLMLNLMFMFVEMLYGYWTNSLGLISDGFHMLFDCIALLIGLGASVISKWKANETLTYGYGRVEVLSGFINGIFLIFVAFFVLMESMERFMDPPKIETEQLLLVSVLGFMVNMVGIFAFSHGHSHGGHGHSHGGHGHSHGEKKHSHTGEKKHGEKKHGHSHSHGEAGGHGHSHGEKKHKDKHKHGDKKHKHKHDHDHDHDHDHHDHHDHEHDHHDHDHQHDEHCEHDHHDHAHDHHDHAQDHHHHDHAHDHEHVETPSHRRRHKSHHSHGSQGKEYVTVHLHDLEGELEKEAPKKQGWCRCFSGLGANLSGIGLHVLADTLGSVSVIISSSLIMLFDWHIADPICSFCIAIMIAVSVIPLFQECIASLSQRVPDQLQPTLEGILQQIRGMEEVIEVREFHVWEHSSTVVVGTAIILLQDDADEQAVRLAVTPLFQEHCQYFTLQLIKKRFFELEGELHKRNYGQSFNFMAPLSSPAFIGGAEVGYPGAGSGGLSSSGGLGGSGGALSRYGQSDSMLASHTSPPGSLTISVVNNNL